MFQCVFIEFNVNWDKTICMVLLHVLFGSPFGLLAGLRLSLRACMAELVGSSLIIQSLQINSFFFFFYRMNELKHYKKYH